MQNLTQERFHVSPRQIGNKVKFDVNKARDLLPLLGSSMDEASARRIMAVQDSIAPTVTSGTVSTPIQFLQKFAPGHVNVLTGARKIDDAIGFSGIGRWEDEQIVQMVLELVGIVQPYGDYANIPLSSWNNEFNYRSIVRFGCGMEVKELEQRRAAAINVDSGAEKRNAATLQLEITRNEVGFYGYNNGDNFTYGIFNDPGVPGYQTVAEGASLSTEWADKTMLEICNDIRLMIATIVNNSQDVIDEQTTPITMLIPTINRQFLSVQSDFGYSVNDWLKENYPKLRVVSAPQLVGANGGENVTFLYAETVDDGYSTDDRRVWMQAIPTKFMVLGVQQETNGYKESYTNATAGVMLKRPYALTAWTGV